MKIRRLGDDRGSVVAELAVALPAVIVVILLGVGALATAAQQVRLQDAAADAARLAARGETAARVEDAATSAVADAVAETEERGDLICVTVRAPARLPFRMSATGCALEGGR